MAYIDLDKETLESEHICCAISDRKCRQGYELKKSWLQEESRHGHIFRRLDERAKVFIEYVPAENAWIPVTGGNYFALGCFWVSGKYKGNGHGKALIQSVIHDARASGRDGLLAVTGRTKYHFMSDGTWLKNQGFYECDKTSDGFILLALKLNTEAPDPQFNSSVRHSPDAIAEYTVYYSNRCPYTDYHVNTSLAETAAKRELNVNVIKLDSCREAQTSPTPATIFSLFYKGRFVTTDLSVCMHSRFDKIIARSGVLES